MTKLNCGVYQIKNTINKHAYIGSSVDIHRRILKHKRTLNKGTHHNAYLQRSYKKYGAENFIYSVLLYCDKTHTTYFEQTCVNALAPEYNFSNDVVSPMYGKRHSKEMREYFSKIRKGVPKSEEHKRKIGLAHKGKFVSDEIRKKISNSHADMSGENNPRYGAKLSNTTKKKISDATKGRIPWNKGIPRIEETKNKISDSLKGNTPWNKGIPRSEDTKRKISETKRKKRAETQ
jgi:group I intron endonuclease